MLQIRTADTVDYDRVTAFYYRMIDELAHSQYSPAWKKDIFPTRAYLLKSIQNGELYIGETDGQIVSCMVINHEYSEGYQSVRWAVAAADSELLVIHLLGVLPMYARRGIARQMIQKVLDVAREQQLKTVRLDVIEGNLPAEIVYTKIGFQYRETIQLFYEDTGWANFKMFEYVISPDSSDRSTVCTK